MRASHLLSPGFPSRQCAARVQLTPGDTLKNQPTASSRSTRPPSGRHISPSKLRSEGEKVGWRSTDRTRLSSSFVRTCQRSVAPASTFRGDMSKTSVPTRTGIGSLESSSAGGVFANTPRHLYRHSRRPRAAHTASLTSSRSVELALSKRALPQLMGSAIRPGRGSPSKNSFALGCERGFTSSRSPAPSPEPLRTAPGRSPKAAVSVGPGVAPCTSSCGLRRGS